MSILREKKKIWASQKQNCCIFFLGPCSFPKRKQTKTKLLLMLISRNFFHIAFCIRFPHYFQYSPIFLISSYTNLKAKNCPRVNILKMTVGNNSKVFISEHIFSHSKLNMGGKNLSKTESNTGYIIPD